MSTATSMPQKLTSSALRDRSLAGILAALMLAGLVFRIAPLFDQGGRLLRQWPTEDGYLMLTIARNIALGLGMSTAAGTIPTNGTQPLCTFLWAACYWLAGGDKVAGVLLVQILSVLLAIAAAYALYWLGCLILRDWQKGRAIAAAAAALWFASPICVANSMNCLETGTVTLLLIVCAGFFVSSWARYESWSLARCVSFGGLLGLTFWARIDACLFILAACLTRLLAVQPFRLHALRRRLAEVLVFGATSVAVASPWLVYNRVNFGSIMPISGTAQSRSAAVGQNLEKVPAALAEYITIVGQIPQALETKTATIVAVLALLTVIIAAVARQWPRLGRPARLGLGFLVLYGMVLCGWYGLFFGAGHFIGRYLFPLSPFLALLTMTIVWHVAGAARRRWRVPILSAALATLVLLAAGLNVRLYLKGPNHMHFQIVEWVRAHVPQDAWAGAVQTGTLGYFHDRTINLDGKVNPHAMAAQLKDGLAEYVVSSPIAFLADWSGIATWHDTSPLIRDNFDVVVCDEYRNLGVLARQSALRRTHSSGAR